MIRRYSGRRLQALRRAAGLRQQDFADRIGRSLGAVRAYEAGTRKPPPDLMADIVAVLNADLNDLYVNVPDGGAECRR